MVAPASIRLLAPAQQRSRLNTGMPGDVLTNMASTDPGSPVTREGHGPRLVLPAGIPAAVSAGQASGDDWGTAVSLLTSYDPYSVFSNPFLDALLTSA
jgi:hypothetical protein